MKPEDCVRRLRELTDPNTYSGPQSIASTARLASTIIERLAGELKAVTDAGFRIEKNVAHPFLGPTDEDRLTLWCIECGRDSGYHREDCSKSNSR